MENYIIPDIWHETGVINWELLKRRTPFLIIKATQRADFVSPTLDKYIQKCEELKIPYFLYSYFEKGNEKTQAEFLVKTSEKLIGPYFVGYGLDFERGNAVSDICSAIDYTLSVCKKVMVYIPNEKYSITKEIVNRGYDKKVKFWLPRYGLNNGKYIPLFPPRKEASLHQYTEYGVVDYILGTVDLNRLTGLTELSWFTTPTGSKTEKPVEKEPEKVKVDPNPISGKIITLPKRGYYIIGDGYTTNKDLKDDIKLLQTLVNWILHEDGEPDDLVVDGKYGKKTRAAVEVVQAYVGVKIDGLFGPKTLEAAMKFVKES